MIERNSLPADIASAPQAEADVLGSILIQGEFFTSVAAIIGPGDFFSPVNGAIFTAMAAVNAAGSPIHLVTVEQHLRDRDQLSAVGGRAYLLSLGDGVSAPMLAPRYAQMIRDKADFRAGIVAADAIRDAALDPSRTLDDLKIFAADTLRPIGGRGKHAPIGIGEIMLTFTTLAAVVIDGLLRRSEVMTLIGASKSMKTWLVMALAVSIATGRDWLGFRVQRGRVLVIDFELHPSVIADRMRRVQQGLGVNLDDIGGRLDYLPMRGKQFNITDLDALSRGWEPGQYDAIILDPLYRLYAEGHDENSNADAARLYAMVAQIAARIGAAVIIVHHLAKGSADGKRTIDQGAGAGAVARSGDVHAVMVPGSAANPQAENECTLKAVVRSFPPPGDIPLHWSDFHWERAQGGEARVPAEMTVEEFARQFVSVKPVSSATIHAAAKSKGIQLAKSKSMLPQAVDAGFVTEKQTGKKVVYCLSSGPEQHSESP